jgi:hypothetical protein
MTEEGLLLGNIVTAVAPFIIIAAARANNKINRANNDIVVIITMDGTNNITVMEERLLLGNIVTTVLPFLVVATRRANNGMKGMSGTGTVVTNEVIIGIPGASGGRSVVSVTPTRYLLVRLVVAVVGGSFTMMKSVHSNRKDVSKQ